VPAPAPHGQTYGAGRLRGHLQALRGHPRQAGEFADHSAQTPMAQRFLKAAEDRSLIAGFEEDDAVLGQTGLRQRRGKQVGLAVAPQDLPFRARGYAGGKGRGRRAIYRSIGAAGDLVKSAQGKPALRKAPVDLGNPERQDGARSSGDAADPLDLVAKVCDARGILSWHSMNDPFWSALLTPNGMM